MKLARKNRTARRLIDFLPNFIFLRHKTEVTLKRVVRSVVIVFVSLVVVIGVCVGVSVCVNGGMVCGTGLGSGCANVGVDFVYGSAIEALNGVCIMSFLKKCAIPGLFIYFRLFNTVETNVQQILQMTGVELRTFGIESDRSTN